MSTTRIPRLSFLALTAAALAVGPLAAQWSGWRGPAETGVSTETRLPEKIEGSILWRQPIGGGRSTPVVQKGRVVISTRSGDGVDEHERLSCFDAVTGKILWEHALNVFHTTVPGPRVGWANPVGDPETGNFYFHGVEGLMNCYDAGGKLLWSHSLTEDFGRISGYGGRTNTPMIVDDLVVLSFLNASWGDQGPGAHRFVAFDKRSGEVVWWSSPAARPEDTTYSTPVVAVVNGEKLLICAAADGNVYALRAGTGESVWSFLLSKRGLNVSPVVDGHWVWMAHSEESLDTTEMGRVVCIDARGKGDITKTNERWRVDGLGVGYASPALHDGRLYVVDNSANLLALDAATGKEHWRKNIGTVGKASPVVADGKIYIGEANGRFHILSPKEKECATLATHEFRRASDGTESEIFGSVAVADGRIYFTTRDEMVCLGSAAWQGERGTPRPLPAVTPVAAGEPAASMLVTPGDVSLHVGEGARFRARLYNARGQYLRDAAGVEWALEGLKGSMDPSGELKVPLPVTVAFQGGRVRAKSGELTAAARVRVTPRLPIALDFTAADAKLPAGWIGLSPVKFEIAEIDGDKCLMKHGKDQRFTRAQAYFGASDLADYTAASDVRGVYRRRTLPDMGIINQRYRLELMGELQVLRVLAWESQMRFAMEVSFPWKQDIWYRMVLRVEQRDGKAYVRAKVWPRAEKEPDAWTIDGVDTFPNTRGSPGIYAFSAGTTDRSPGTDVYFDNLSATPND